MPMEARHRPRRGGSPPAPDRAAGVLEEVVDATGRIKADCRKAVFGRKALAFRVRAWYPGVAEDMGDALVRLVPGAPDPGKQWLQTQFEGTWPPPLSRKGCAIKPGKEKAVQAQGRCSNAGCFYCRRHVVLVIRGATQLARRLQNVADPSRTRLLRAARSPDDSRLPFEKRRSASATARRIVRGDPKVPQSADWWPGEKAGMRPPALRPED